MRTYLAIAITGLALFGASSAVPQSAARAELTRIEIEQAKAKERLAKLSSDAAHAKREADRLQRQLVQAARRRSQLEVDVTQKESRLMALTRRQDAIQSAIVRDRAALENVVVALIAIERDRPPTLAVQPKNATEAARASILMGLVAPELDKRAAELSRRMQELADVRRAVLLENADYRRANDDLEKARADVGGLIAQYRQDAAQLQTQAGEEQKNISRRASRANSLRDLIVRLGDALPTGFGQVEAPALVSNLDRQKGRLPRPIYGQTIAQFGSTLANGSRSDGVVIRGRAGAQVRAPADGRIEFVGPFRTFGQVVIINAGQGHYMVLAGLGATFADVGQNVLAGEPIAEMALGNDTVPDLYVEIRHNGVAENPEEWLMSSR